MCALVVIGVNDRGEKHFLAIEDGTRESEQSWVDVLSKLKGRGMNPPELAIGDGALGFWKAADNVWPTTRHQRCLMHKQQNVLNHLPSSRNPRRKSSSNKSGTLRVASTLIRPSTRS